jgi:putative transposase
MGFLRQCASAAALELPIAHGLLVAAEISEVAVGVLGDGTGEHIHLLVKDTGSNVTAESMQLIAGRTAQEYNQRKNRQGAFWEDRYHATAVAADEHLYRCLVYIELNMVRAGVVHHPGTWKESGFIAIQKPPKRYAVIDLQSLSELSGFANVGDFQRAHREWVDRGLENGVAVRDDRWSEAIAVGSLAFVESVKDQLGAKGADRDVIDADGGYALRETTEAYAGRFTSEIDALRPQNTFLWDETVDEAKT